jgi:hypothetical protein
MLELTEATVNSALQRARGAVHARLPAGAERTARATSAAEHRLVDDFTEAFERGEVERVVALLTDDAVVSMPPQPHEYQGRTAVRQFLEHIGFAARARAGRRSRLIPTQANRQPALANYLGAADERLRFSGLLVLTLRDDGISALTRFGLPDLYKPFALPAAIPATADE